MAYWQRNRKITQIKRKLGLKSGLIRCWLEYLDIYLPPVALRRALHLQQAFAQIGRSFPAVGANL